MLQNAYFLAKIGADTAENEQHSAEILPIRPCEPACMSDGTAAQGVGGRGRAPGRARGHDDLPSGVEAHSSTVMISHRQLDAFDAYIRHNMRIHYDIYVEIWNPTARLHIQYSFSISPQPRLIGWSTIAHLIEAHRPIVHLIEEERTFH